MQLSTTTLAPLRNVASYVLGAISFAGAAHFLTPADVTNLTNGVNQVTSGLKSVYDGALLISATAGPFVGVAMAWWSQRAAKKAADPVTQATALVANVPGTTVVTSAALANATPDVSAIVSNAEKMVVTK
jgi:hypothetical protein